MKRGHGCSVSLWREVVSVRTLLLIAAVSGCVGLMGGCGTSAHEVWKGTKKLYAEYLNPPASVDYEDKGALSEAESRLAMRMLGIDQQLENLERFLENQDKPPTSDVVSRFFMRFPWLSGLAAVDASGEVLAQEPSVPMKPLDFTLILEADSQNGSSRGLRVCVQDTPLGPEIFMGMPIYEHSELRGFLVCHFDMRALLKYVDNPGELVILSPEGVLWAGHFAVGATPLADRKWGEITKSAVEGTVSDSTGQFIWLARFLGKTPIIFASPVKGYAMENVDEAEAPDSGAFAAPYERTDPVRESEVIESVDESLLLAPLPPVRPLGLEETPISDQ